MIGLPRNGIQSTVKIRKSVWPPFGYGIGKVEQATCVALSRGCAIDKDRRAIAPRPVNEQSRQRKYSVGGFVFKGARHRWLPSLGLMQMIVKLSNSPKPRSP